MNLRKKFYDNFSNVLALALIFIALPAIAAAQDGNNEIYLTNPDSGVLAVQQSGAATSGSNHSNTILVGMGDGSVRAQVSRIIVPNSLLTFSSVNADDPNLMSKTRALFDAVAGLRGSIIITLPRGSLDASGRVPKIELFVSDGSDPGVLAVELQNCLISSYQVSGAGGGSLPMESLSLNFTKIEFKNGPLN